MGVESLATNENIAIATLAVSLGVSLGANVAQWLDSKKTRERSQKLTDSIIAAAQKMSDATESNTEALGKLMSWVYDTKLTHKEIAMKIDLVEKAVQSCRSVR